MIAEKKLTTWVLVADHQRARVFSAAGHGSPLEDVDRLSTEDPLPVSHEAGDHRPDIGYASRGGPQHGYEPKQTPHDKAALRFVDRIAAAVAKEAEAGAFDQLVLVAPPRALGEFRAALPDAVTKRVIATINHDLTKATRDEVAAQVRQTVRI